MKLLSGIKCIVSDSHWLYGCCDNGKIYDLGQGIPRVAYELPDAVETKKMRSNARILYLFFCLIYVEVVWTVKIVF